MIIVFREEFLSQDRDQDIKFCSLGVVEDITAGHLTLTIYET